MKFECSHRLMSGAVVKETIDVVNRAYAFAYAKEHKWLVVEMKPIVDVVKKVSSSEPRQQKEVKIPNDEELELLIMRKNAFNIGVFGAFLPFIGWIIALFASFVKYDMRGLKCCAYGSLMTSWFFVAMFFGVGFLCHIGDVSGYAKVLLVIGGAGLMYLSLWMPIHGYHKDILRGFTLPKNIGDRL